MELKYNKALLILDAEQWFNRTFMELKSDTTDL